MAKFFFKCIILHTVLFIILYHYSVFNMIMFTVGNYETVCIKKYKKNIRIFQLIKNTRKRNKILKRHTIQGLLVFLLPTYQQLRYSLFIYFEVVSFKTKIPFFQKGQSLVFGAFIFFYFTFYSKNFFYWKAAVNFYAFNTAYSILSALRYN